MKAARTASEEAPAAKQTRAAESLDSGETRAVVLAASAITVFLYFIKAILLPFLLASIVAYICTPPLDWLARRTRWPRLLFAIAAFLIIIGIAGLILAFAAQHLAAETRSIATDL